MALDHTPEILSRPWAIFFEVLKLWKQNHYLVAEKIEKVTCESDFKIYQHPYNLHHSHNFDDSEYCK